MSFEDAVKPLIKYLKENHHPHTTIIADSNHAELLEGIKVFNEAMELDIERLAALEHEQWAHWTEYMLTNLTPENISRWKKQVQIPYSELSEAEKELDRKWARKVMNQRVKESE